MPAAKIHHSRLVQYLTPDISLSLYASNKSRNYRQQKLPLRHFFHFASPAYVGPQIDISIDIFAIRYHMIYFHSFGAVTWVNVPRIDNNKVSPCRVTPVTYLHAMPPRLWCFLFISSPTDILASQQYFLDEDLHFLSLSYEVSLPSSHSFQPLFHFVKYFHKSD